MGRKIMSAGHICIDLTPAIPEQNRKLIQEVLTPGKLINVDPITISVGGTVNNTGLAMKILGEDVTLAGKIGCDEFGDMIAAELRKYDADGGLIRKEGETTSYSVVLAVPGIDRVFLHHTGANDTLTADDISEEALAATDLFHFGYPPLMRQMFINEGEGLVAVMKKAHDAGCATSLDMAMVDPNADSGKEDWNAILRKTLPYVDIFVPSVEELLFMLDREKYEAKAAGADGQDLCEILDVEEDIRPLAEQCLAYGVKIVLIKCGAPGMYCRTASAETLSEISPRLELPVDLWADKAFYEKSYVPDRILSGTGAGDTSIAAFLVSMARGNSAERSMQFATAEGASCVAGYGALDGIKSLEELAAKIDAGWKKNE